MQLGQRFRGAKSDLPEYARANYLLRTLGMQVSHFHAGESHGFEKLEARAHGPGFALLWLACPAEKNSFILEMHGDWQRRSMTFVCPFRPTYVALGFAFARACKSIRGSVHLYMWEGQC